MRDGGETVETVSFVIDRFGGTYRTVGIDIEIRRTVTIQGDSGDGGSAGSVDIDGADNGTDGNIFRDAKLCIAQYGFAVGYVDHVDRHVRRCALSRGVACRGAECVAFGTFVIDRRRNADRAVFIDTKGTVVVECEAFDRRIAGVYYPHGADNATWRTVFSDGKFGDIEAWGIFGNIANIDRNLNNGTFGFGVGSSGFEIITFLSFIIDCSCRTYGTVGIDTKVVGTIPGKIDLLDGRASGAVDLNGADNGSCGSVFRDGEICIAQYGFVVKNIFDLDLDSSRFAPSRRISGTYMKYIMCFGLVVQRAVDTDRTVFIDGKSTVVIQCKSFYRTIADIKNIDTSDHRAYGAVFSNSAFKRIEPRRYFGNIAYMYRDCRRTTLSGNTLCDGAQAIRMQRFVIECARHTNRTVVIDAEKLCAETFESHMCDFTFPFGNDGHSAYNRTLWYVFGHFGLHISEYRRYIGNIGQSDDKIARYAPPGAV